jgi:hypothetical protein
MEADRVDDRGLYDLHARENPPGDCYWLVRVAVCHVFSSLLIDEASFLPPADHGIRGAAAVDGRLAVDREDSATVDGRQLLSQ